MNHFEQILSTHSFFKDLALEQLKILAGCCTNRVFQPGEMIAHESGPADNFYIIREGKAAIQIFTHDRGAVTLQTVGPDDVVGWSWLFPPYKWNFDIKAIEKTRTVALDGRCLREKCDNNHELGYVLMKKFSQVMIGRLQSARMQILDIYKETPQ